VANTVPDQPQAIRSALRWRPRACGGRLAVAPRLSRLMETRLDLDLDTVHYSTQKKRLLPPPSPHHDLVLAHLEPINRRRTRDLDRVPGNVKDLPGLVVDEVVMRLDMCVEDDDPVFQGLQLEQPLLGEEIEGIVDRRA